MPEKAVYSLTDAGREAFERLMDEISRKPVNLFLDFNAVIVNLESMPPESREECLNHIESNVAVLKNYLTENMALKEDLPTVPATGKAVLRQQLLLVQAIEAWIGSLKEELASMDGTAAQ